MALTKQGPLSGVRVVEIASIGPGPFAAMMLADAGADVVRLERADASAGLGSGSWNQTHRGRPSVGCDLKHPEGRELALRLCESADALIEGFRPGVMERLGLGPDEVLARNPKLVYGRMTGWGQDGPMASQSGHDINYIAIGGVLGAFAREGERPLFPLNLVGDYGGGAMMLAFGVLAGILNVRSGGEGQVVDAAMVEGSSLLATLVRSMADIGMWSDAPGTNLLDSGAHFYEVYECADGGHFAVGAIEPQFYAELLRLLELDPAEFPQLDRDRWPEFKEAFAELFMTRTRDEWSAVFEGSEACATPVLTFAEAPAHPHNAARGSFIEVGGKVQPGPAPRFSGTPAGEPSPAPEPGANTDEALTAWGVAADEIASLRDSGAVA
ncbi:MAG: CoA transferase [Thermoleophilales bacterium]|nr:CoA transferase [Thermoleophilales bacterium]